MEAVLFALDTVVAVLVVYWVATHDGGRRGPGLFGFVDRR